MLTRLLISRGYLPGCRLRAAVTAGLGALWLGGSVACGQALDSEAPAEPHALEAPAATPDPGAPLAEESATAPEAEVERPMYIREYRVQGARQLSRLEVEEAVYPFLGPGRTSADVEQARAALEKAYKEKGFETVSVQFPQQRVRRGIVRLEVTEATVGRLRVKGARYFLPSAIKERARSVAEGKVVNFNEVTRDMLALNQLSDRTITPELREGAEPGTVDIDLNVKDTLPLHGSLELNNRSSPDTTRLRLSGSLSYDNLWQAGHSLDAGFQVSPEAPDEVKVFTGSYIARLPQVDWLSLLLQYTKSDSNVNTLGNIAVVGRGETIGARAIITLPTGKDFYQSVNFGFDFKRTEQLTLAQEVEDALSDAGLAIDAKETTYQTITAAYSGTWSPKGSLTEVNVGLTFGLRGARGRNAGFEEFRFEAEKNFVTLRGDLSHKRDLPAGFEAYGQVQGQLSDQPLISNEQFTGGGLGTARGYLEAEVVGDNALFGTLELRSPSLLTWLKGKGNDWRLYAFVDAGVLQIREPLPEQIDRFELASYGFGTRVQLLTFLNASLDAGIPLISQRSQAHDLLLTFRVWAEF